MKFNRPWNLFNLAAGSMLALAMGVPAAEAGVSSTPPGEMLLLDSLGRTVKVPTNEIPRNLHPPAELGLKHQLPMPTKGVNMPGEVLQRNQEARGGVEELQFFPATQPQLMPYLASQDEFGNTAIKHGALISLVPLEPLLQGGKYWLSENGLRYSLDQTLAFVNMSDVMQGDNSLSFYTFDLQAKWLVFDAPSAGTAGWISTQIEAKTGLGSAGQTQDARRNLGTITDPTGIWSSVNGFRIPELAWQQSLRNGEVVLVAGMISQGNYFDANAYAQSGRSQFINSGLINSMVMPLPNYNFGLNAQWQPKNEWYAMVGASAGNGSAGHAPWTDFNWNSWSLLGEIGYMPDDFLGLGPGAYRLQPFVAQAGGPVQGGLCFNLRQQLGRHSPFGWFGRFGFGGSEVTAGASAQIGTGFVMHAPLAHAGLVPKLNNDLLGIGFVWSQPSATTKTVYHENEYIAESFYTLQLTPTMKLQADFQVVWDPAFNPDAGLATVFQLQLNLAW